MAYHPVGAGRGEIVSLRALAIKFIEANLAVGAPSVPATAAGSGTAHFSGWLGEQQVPRLTA
jgi:hypothetical protein